MGDQFDLTSRMIMYEKWGGGVPDLWDDLRFPAGGFNPAGSTAPPSVDTTTGLLSFSGSINNIIGGVAQLPHTWKEGSDLYPHLHLVFPTPATKNTRWKLEYNRANNNEEYEAAYGSYVDGGTITIANPNNAKTLLLPAGWDPITMTGYRVSCCILWRITRLAASDILDDDTGACVYVEFDIHYQSNSAGSVERNTKR